MSLNLGFLWEAQLPLLKWKLKLPSLQSKTWQHVPQKFKQQLKGTIALYLQDANCYSLEGTREFDSWFLNIWSFSNVSLSFLWLRQSHPYSVSNGQCWHRLSRNPRGALLPGFFNFPLQNSSKYRVFFYITELYGTENVVASKL